MDFFKIFLNNYRRNHIRYFSEGNTDGMKRVIVFCTPFLSVNPSIIIFYYYQRTYRRIKNYRRKIHRRSISVSDFVGKLITNGIIIQIPTENFYNKYKNCGSGERITALYHAVQNLLDVEIKNISTPHTVWVKEWNGTYFLKLFVISASISFGFVSEANIQNSNIQRTKPDYKTMEEKGKLMNILTWARLWWNQVLNHQISCFPTPSSPGNSKIEAVVVPSLVIENLLIYNN
jgi:hypothetical protein